MSKKLHSTAKWKQRIRARQDYQLRTIQRRRRRPSEARPLAKTPEKQSKFHKVAAPTTFSIVENPHQVVPFFRELEFYASKGRSLTVDLSQVKRLTADAVAVLVATVERLPVNVRGSYPDDPVAQRILIESGFFEHMRSLRELPRVRRGGTILQEKKSKKVQGDVARDLIRFGTDAVFGAPRQSRAAYRVMIESMANTHNHAAGKKQEETETWWGTVFADVERKRVCFTFLDTGIGIFQSVHVGGLRSLYRRVGITNDADIMRDMLLGKVASSTRQPYRGKGIPGIYKLSLLGRIRSLVIIANGVYANIDKDEYRMLQTQFRGTLLYWEISEADSV